MLVNSILLFIIIFFILIFYTGSLSQCNAAMSTICFLQHTDEYVLWFVREAIHIFEHCSKFYQSRKPIDTYYEKKFINQTHF